MGSGRACISFPTNPGIVAFFPFSCPVTRRKNKKPTLKATFANKVRFNLQVLRSPDDYLNIAVGRAAVLCSGMAGQGPVETCVFQVCT